MTPARRQLLVWPLWQRALHWALAIAVVTALSTFEGGPVHQAAGYAALALALLRVALGWIGPAPARFSSFVRGPRATWACAVALWRGAEAVHLNHNPLGAWMVLALLGLVGLGAGSGALYVTDRFWGDASVIGLHAALSWPLAALVPLHIAGVIFTSWRGDDNLLAAMLHGRKTSPRNPDDPA